ELVVRQRLELFVALPQGSVRLAHVIPAAGPGGLQQGQAQHPVRVTSREGEDGRATAGIAEEVEAVPASAVGEAAYPRHFGVETVVRRWCRPGVDLELLRDGVHARPELRDESRIGH